MFGFRVTKGQLIEETTGELRRKGQRIAYEYDEFGRNSKTVYPGTEAAEYAYGAPQERITLETNKR
jgi:YD repeat-containing protein